VSILREAALKHAHAHEPGFRWRGREVSRLEGLSDAVFAFAITLLVISLEVPRDYHELVDAMRGFVAFIFSFTLLYRLWVTQYRFFRRYGLEDQTTIRLNGVLLFMVLFFVYPLKFLTYAVTRFVVEHGFGRLRPTAFNAVLHDPDGRLLVMFYFFGSAAVFATLGLMYRHAYRRRHALELTPHEAHRTREAYQRLFLGAAVATVGPLGALTLFTPYETVGAGDGRGVRRAGRGDGRAGMTATAAAPMRTAAVYDAERDSAA
jgi:uncharacterized membrane protein